MADRSIIVRLRAQVDGFKAEMAAAAKAAEATGKASEQAAKQADTAMGRMVQSATQHRAAWDTAGTTLAGFGAATLGALGMATKAAMDWESAWAGVTKTTDGSTAQMAVLEQGLRGLATTLPSTHEEIAAVAEAAGQLGVQRDAIVGFTRTMIDLGETTNLSADEAATAIAQFSNVMGTSSDDVGNFGSALVALGNDGASTERDILMMAQRLSGAGKLIGASEQGVMALSSALSSVGISAEMGGGALSRVLQDMNTAVLEGGDSLDLFAKTAGMSASEFSAAWRTDPIVALDAFTQGLNGVTENGGNAIGVLSDLGIKSSEETRALMSLAGAGTLLSDSLDTANTSWEENTALLDEATKRYDTAESRIQVARNQLVDFGIDIGGVVLPALAGLAEKGGDLASWMQGLPAPVKATGTAMAGLAGAASLGAGAFLLVVPRVLETAQAFRQLKEDGSAIPGVLGKVGKAAAGLTILAAVPGLVKAATDSMRGIDRADFDLGTNELAASLLEAKKSGDVFGATMGDLTRSGALNKQMFDDLGGSITKVANMNLADKFAVMTHLDATGVEEMQGRLDDLGGSLAVMAQTDLPQAQETFAAFWDEARRGGASFDDVLKTMPAFKDQLVGIATEMGESTDSATLLRIATGQISPAAADAAGGMSGLAGKMGETQDAGQELQDQLTELANAFLDQRANVRDYEAALDDASKAIDENGRTLDVHTEKGRANEEALDRIGRTAFKVADAMRESGEAPGAFLQGARDEIISTAKEMGKGQEEAEAYADSLGLTPEFIATQATLDTAEATATANTYSATLDELVDKKVSTQIDADTASGDHKIGGFMQTLEGVESEGATVPIDAATESAEGSLFELSTAIANTGGTVTINGSTVNASAALDMLQGQINASDGTVTINGQSVPAKEALGTLISEVNAGKGTVTIQGNKGPADQATSQAVAKANSSTGTIDVTAATGLANAAIDSAARDRTARINVVATGAVSFANAVLGRASGGPIYGAGTGTSDSIPAVLSNGEHVLTAREVEMAGGQAAIFRMREGIRMGALRFAGGGGLERGAPVRMTPAPWVDPRLLRAPAPAASAPSGPLIGSLTVAAVEGQSPREQGQYIAGYLGAHLNI